MSRAEIQQVRARREAFHYRAIAMLAIATIFWGLSFPLAKGLYLLQGAGSDLPDATLARTAVSLVVRFLLAAGVIALFLRGGLARTTRQEWRLGLGIGVFGALAMLFQMDGLQHTDVATSAFLTQLYCVLIPLYKTLRHRRAPGVRTFAAVALAVAGFGLFSGVKAGAFALGRGETETALCALLFSGQILWLERPAFRGADPWRVTFLQFLVIGLGLVPFCFVGGSAGLMAAMAPYAAWESWALTVTLVLFCTVASYGIMNVYQPRIDATEAGLIYTIEPVFASVAAMALPSLLERLVGVPFENEFVTARQAIGGLLIFLANLCIFFPDRWVWSARRA